MFFRRVLNRESFNQLRNYCSKGSTDNTGVSKDSASNAPCPQIFSREGDYGTSKTITGEALPKDSPIFSAIGAAEELLSYIGLAREYANESEHEYTDKLKRIQTIIIDISTAISRNSKVAIPPVYTKELEDWISEYAKQLPPAMHVRRY
ncbi:hypothetical protein HUJ05_007932 [Dendroctonus ponderosae]|nr:hypothetical protein HUJ05_007932 [Dendroctonus ponderosae]